MVIERSCERAECCLAKKSDVDPSKSVFQDHHGDDEVPDDNPGDIWRNLNLLADTLLGIVDIERKFRSLEENNHVECMSHRGPLEDNIDNDDDQCTSSKRLVGLDRVLLHGNETPYFDMDMPDESFELEQKHNRNVDAASGGKKGSPELETARIDLDSEDNSQKTVPNALQTEHANNSWKTFPNSCGIEYVNISSNSEGDHNEMIDIEMLMHPQFSCSQDDREKVDQRELHLCMKCNEGGKLLVCCSTSCSSVIHESCLDSDASFDAGGKFNCPSCAYFSAILNYLEAKKKAALARNELATFIGGGNRKQSNENPSWSFVIIQNRFHEDDLHDRYEWPGEFEKGAYKRRKVSDSELAVPSGLCSGDNPLGEAVASINELNKNLNKYEQEAKRTGQDCRAPRVHEHGEMAPMANFGFQGECTEFISEKEVNSPPEENFCSEIAYSSNTESINAEDISGEESEDSGVSKYLISPRVLENQCSDPELRKLRRKRIPWRIEEELALKGGMERFCRSTKRNMPWKKILEHGANTFHESRTAVDLKDKWRNVKKTIMKLYPTNESVQKS